MWTFVKSIIIEPMRMFGNTYKTARSRPHFGQLKGHSLDLRGPSIGLCFIRGFKELLEVLADSKPLITNGEVAR